MQHIFISYSRRDIEFMRHISKYLISKNFMTWTDENLTPGTRGWKLAIEKAIEDAGAVVAILSPDAKASEWVDRELEYARIRGKRIFPLIVRGDSATSVPLELVTSQWIDITQRENYAPGMEKLTLALDNHLGMKRKTRSDLIREAVIDLFHKLPNCYYMAVISVDGLSIASHDPGNLNEDRISAMGAAGLSLGARILSELQGEYYRFSITAGSNGTQFCIGLIPEDSKNAGDYEYALVFGLRSVASIDAVLVILRQWWLPLLKLLEVSAPNL